MKNHIAIIINHFSKTICLSCFLLIGFAIFPGISKSQIDNDNISVDDGVNPVESLNKFIKNSYGSVKNKLFQDGKLYGYKDGERVFIRDFVSQETFEFETKNYDSIQFFFEWDDYIVDGFFIRVLDNQPFEYKTSPIMEMTGADLIVENSQLINLFLKDSTGKKLYAVNITDDVNADWVKVEPLPEASLYIDVDKLDSSTYHIKIKNKAIFLGNLSEDIKDKWSKGEEIKFPIGIKMTDTEVPDHTASIYYTLVKKKKQKKINN